MVGGVPFRGHWREGFSVSGWVNVECEGWVIELTSHTCATTSHCIKYRLYTQSLQEVSTFHCPRGVLVTSTAKQTVIQVIGTSLVTQATAKILLQYSSRSHKYYATWPRPETRLLLCNGDFVLVEVNPDIVSSDGWWVSCVAMVGLPGGTIDTGTH